MTRPRRVYRLAITYPPRSHPSQPDWDDTWQPEGWVAEIRAEWAKYRTELAAFKAAGGDPDDPFAPMPPRTPEDMPWTGWPATRLYLSRGGAEKRAALFCRYGASVTVHPSDPITWPVDHREATP